MPLIFRLLLALFFSISLLTLSCQVEQQNYEYVPVPDSLLQYEDPRSGVVLSVEADSAIFPLEWQTETINPNFRPLSYLEYGRSRSSFLKAMGKYSPELLKDELKTVYFLEHLEFFGVEFGGTNSLNAIYLTNAGRYRGYTDEYLERIFHHEFSSILLRNYSYLMDSASWKALNTLPYGNGGVEAIRQGNLDEKGDDYWNKMGFAYDYGQSSFENDFNTIAEVLFRPSADFWEMLEQEDYEVLRKKVDKAIEFYQVLDSTYTVTYFQSLISEEQEEEPSFWESLKKWLE
jgi:hypothetical protein